MSEYIELAKKCGGIQIQYTGPLTVDEGCIIFTEDELTTYSEALRAKDREEIKITDKLLAEQYRVIDVIPPCSLHGNRCVPHAVEWISEAKVLIGRQEKLEEELAAEREARQKAEAEELLPLQRQVAILNNAITYALVDVEGDEWIGILKQAVNDTKATAEAYDKEHAAKVLEDLINNYLFFQFDSCAWLKKEIEKDIAELRVNKKDN